MVSSFNLELFCHHGGGCTCDADKNKKCSCGKPNCDGDHKGENKEHTHNDSCKHGQ